MKFHEQSCGKGPEINATWNEKVSQEGLMWSVGRGEEFLRKRHLNSRWAGAPQGKTRQRAEHARCLQAGSRGLGGNGQAIGAGAHQAKKNAQE